MSSIEDRVIAVVTKQLEVDASQVKMESRFNDDLGADSLDQVELVMAFEEEFDLEIPNDTAEKIVRVKDAVDLIKARIASDA